MVSEHRNGDVFLINVREMTPPEFDKMFEWCDENFVQYSRVGAYWFYVEGKEDATMLKMFWG